MPPRALTTEERPVAEAFVRVHGMEWAFAGRLARTAVATLRQHHQPASDLLPDMPRYTKRGPYTDDEKRIVREMWPNHTALEIAHAIDRNEWSVATHIQRHGLQKEGHAPRKSETAKMPRVAHYAKNTASPLSCEKQGVDDRKIVQQLVDLGGFPAWSEERRRSGAIVPCHPMFWPVSVGTCA